MPVERLLSIEEVAAHTRVSLSAVRYWIREHKLKPTVLIGRRRLVPESSLAAFIADRMKDSAPRPTGFGAKRRNRRPATKRSAR